jgi:hypothetical protein
VIDIVTEILVLRFSPIERAMTVKWADLLANAIRGRDRVASKATDMSNRSQVRARYRQLREISKQHNSAVMKFLSDDAIVSLGRRLGMAHGKTLIADSEDELHLVFDLAIHTALKDRSRAIDRYAAAAQLVPESDESLVLEAMRRARFSIIRLVRRHPVAGLIVKDVFRNDDIWLVDEGLEASFAEGVGLAARLFMPESFAMTAGVIVPASRESIAAALDDTPLLKRKSDREMVDDRRFAEAIYRGALENGLTDRIAYQDTGVEFG